MWFGCPAPSGWVPNNGDCDDLDPLISPDAIEGCDGDKNDCSGSTDDGDLCISGLSCCGGTFLDTSIEPEHCGACGNSCDLLNTDVQNCESGNCQVATCDTGYEDCNDLDTDGCEVDIDGDPSNCGTCGYVCDLANTDGHTCLEGSCLVATCDSGYGDCNGLDVDGCETNLGVDTDDASSDWTLTTTTPGAANVP